jgi:hypothetical protein
MYNFQFQYPRCGAVRPGMFLPVLMFQGQTCSLFFRSFTMIVFFVDFEKRRSLLLLNVE